jgi:hypothetical protein
VVALTGIGEVVADGLPACGGHRSAEVVEGCATTDDRLATRTIGGAHHPPVIGEQIDH